MNSPVRCCAFVAGTSKFCCVGGHADDLVTNKRTTKQIVQKTCLKATTTGSLRIADSANSPHIHLGLVYPRLMKSEAVSLSLPRTNCLKYLTIIANKQHLVKWTEFIFPASSVIVLWPLLISPSGELIRSRFRGFSALSRGLHASAESQNHVLHQISVLQSKSFTVYTLGSWKNSEVG